MRGTGYQLPGNRKQLRGDVLPQESRNTQNNAAVNVPAKAIQREVRIVNPLPWKELFIFVTVALVYGALLFAFGYQQAMQRCSIENAKSCPVITQQETLR